MSVNLDNVKAIVHNNKNVVKIEDSHGIVWQAPPSEGWHTVWEGSQTFPSSQSDASYRQKICDLPMAMWNYNSSSFKLRLYFSNLTNTYSTSNRWFFIGSTSTTTPPTSPIEVTITPGTYGWKQGYYYYSRTCPNDLPRFFTTQGARYVPGVGSFQKYLHFSIAHNGSVILTSSGYMLTSNPTALEFGMYWEKNDATYDNHMVITKVEAYY